MKEFSKPNVQQQYKEVAFAIQITKLSEYFISYYSHGLLCVFALKTLLQIGVTDFYLFKDWEQS